MIDCGRGGTARDDLTPRPRAILSTQLQERPRREPAGDHGLWVPLECCGLCLDEFFELADEPRAPGGWRRLNEWRRIGPARCRRRWPAHSCDSRTVARRLRQGRWRQVARRPAILAPPTARPARRSPSTHRPGRRTRRRGPGGPRAEVAGLEAACGLLLHRAAERPRGWQTSAVAPSKGRAICDDAAGRQQRGVERAEESGASGCGTLDLELICLPTSSESVALNGSRSGHGAGAPGLGHMFLVAVDNLDDPARRRHRHALDQLLQLLVPRPRRFSPRRTSRPDRGAPAAAGRATVQPARRRPVDDVPGHQHRRGATPASRTDRRRPASVSRIRARGRAMRRADTRGPEPSRSARAPPVHHRASATARQSDVDVPLMHLVGPPGDGVEEPLGPSPLRDEPQRHDQRHLGRRQPATLPPAIVERRVRVEDEAGRRRAQDRWRLGRSRRRVRRTIAATRASSARAGSNGSAR